MQSSRAQAADRDQVLTFRLNSHHLGTRLPPGSLLKAAGACGIQNTPPGSAALALHARVADLTPADIRRALEVEKTLLQMWSLRGSPYLFPTSDAAVFTLGLLPPDEESLRAFILGIVQALGVIGMSATEVVARTAPAVLDVLDNRELTNKQQLDREVAGRVAERLPPAQLTAWQSPSWYGPDQRVGEALVSFALRPISLQGLICFAPRRGNEAAFVRTDQWLGAPLPCVDPECARAELVRHYLHGYGLDFGGRRTWLLAHDVACLVAPPASVGVRFLPPHDPYLQLRDRATLIPDKALQRQVWRQSGNPGVVLAGGRFVATWRPDKQRNQLAVTVALTAPVSGQIRSEIEAEAATLAPFKGSESVTVNFTEPT